MPKVSVVVCTMNEKKYIQPLIDSLKNQTFKDFEMIAIDLSKDETPQILKEAGWKVYKQKSKGISLARAEGVAASSTGIIAFTDADTALHEVWVENIYKTFQDPKVVVAYGPVRALDGPWYLKLLQHVFYGLFLHINRLIRRDHTAGMNFAFRKSAYQKIGGFRPDLWTAEDIDLSLRLRKHGKVKYNKNIKVYTSTRRMVAQGMWKFMKHHTKNYFRMQFKGKGSKDFEPIR